MNCNIIKDLLPSYIDEICSEETKQLVDEHLKECEECKGCLETMQQQANLDNQVLEDNVNAITPLKKINRKRYRQVFIATVLTFVITFGIVIAGIYTIQEVPAVNHFFYALERGFVNITDETEWQTVKFNDKDDFLIYKSINVDKQIVSHVVNDEDVLVRVKDETGNILYDEIKVSPGTGSIILDKLEKNQKYYIEIKAPKGKYYINGV